MAPQAENEMGSPRRRKQNSENASLGKLSLGDISVERLHDVFVPPGGNAFLDVGGIVSAVQNTATGLLPSSVKRIAIRYLIPDSIGIFQSSNTTLGIEPTLLSSET